MSERHPADDRPEEGAALILVIIVTVLLYALVWQLVRDGQTARILADNDLLETRMRYHVRYTLEQVEDQLIQDAEAAAAGEEGGAGGLGGLGGALGGGEGGAPGGAPGEGGEEEEPDPATIADGSQDSWFQPTAYTDDDITTYAFVEDENRKFNLLSILSRDEEFAKVSRERLIRLLDVLRDDTDFDLSLGDAELIVGQIEEWTKEGGRSEWLPRPPLRSDSPEGDRRELTIPLTIDELLLLRDVDEELFYDKPWEGRTLLGLESVLTVYTNLAYAPGTPEEQQSGQGTGAPAAGGQPPGGAQPEGGAPEGGAPAGGGPAQGGQQGPVDPETLSAIGQGIRININTAPRPVLRALFDRSQISDEVLDAILEWRNTETEESGEELTDELTTFVEEGVDVTMQMFTDLEQLEDIEEFANIPDTDVKEQFKSLLTVNSDVFSIHFASIQVRDEESRAYVMQRARSVVARVDGDDGTICFPLIRFERRHGMRLMPVDDLDDFVDLGDQANRNREMDVFTQEERAWNPFLLDFYRPPQQREELYDYADRYR